jgi:hypothetical protein
MYLPLHSQSQQQSVKRKLQVTKGNHKIEIISRKATYRLPSSLKD